MKRIHPNDYMSTRTDKLHLAHYITFKPNVLDDSTCDALVALYEANTDKHVLRQQGEHLRFMQLNLTENVHLREFHDLHATVANTTVKALKEYFVDTGCEVDGMIPRTYGLEQLRINKTANNGKDGFGPHTDVGDHASARRFITALYYLNDVDVGGDAAFPNLGFSCRPVKGSMLIFPSTWQYLHQGFKPISQPKYILTSFCHYG